MELEKACSFAEKYQAAWGTEVEIRGNKDDLGQWSWWPHLKNVEDRMIYLPLTFEGLTSVLED